MYLSLNYPDISQSANNFVRDLYKLEHLEGQEARREFNNLMQSYEQMYFIGS